MNNPFCVAARKLAVAATLVLLLVVGRRFALYLAGKGWFEWGCERRAAAMCLRNNHRDGLFIIGRNLNTHKTMVARGARQVRQTNGRSAGRNDTSGALGHSAR